MTAPLYELVHASIRGPLGKALDPIDLEIRDHAVTAVVGPVGSGKSTLLRVLSGRALPEGWELGGQWRYRGRDLLPVLQARVPLRSAAWVPQIRNGPTGEHPDPSELAGIRARLDGAFFCGSAMVLLDEPTRGLPQSDHEGLIARIRERAAQGAAIVISHDRSFTQKVADDVCLLCDGELVTHCSASDFFDRPDDELVAQFVRSGTCARAAPSPTLPRHFHWLQPGRLGGMGRPGLMRELDEDLFAIANAGVNLLVSLTEDPVPTARLRPFGIAGHHFPIRDMGVPAMSDTIALCHRLLRAIERGQVVAVHCHAGLGRTGTILACLASSQGRSAAEAIAEVRRVSPGAIQTEGQESFVRALASYG